MLLKAGVGPLFGPSEVSFCFGGVVGNTSYATIIVFGEKIGPKKSKIGPILSNTLGPILRGVALIRT